jgi:hypothetical protein
VQLAAWAPCVFTMFAIGLAAWACDAPRPSAASSAKATASAAPSTSAPLSEVSEPAKLQTTPQPKAVIALSISAYRASITADAEAAYLLTSEAAYRFTPGRAAEAQRVELGFGATATADAFIFWSDGAVQEHSKRDGRTRRLVGLAAQPQSLVSSGSYVGWVERSPEGRFSLGSIAKKGASSVYTSPGKIDAAAMLSNWIFFVERPTASEWRIGGVRTSGGTPTFTNSRPGRAPSMLVARDELYYYDGNRREVRRVTPDLRSEETLVTNFVCSPLAVSVAKKVYCANVEGIFELVPGARPLALVKLAKNRFATDLAATATDLYWVSDAGPDKLQVSSLPVHE